MGVFKRARSVVEWAGAVDKGIELAGKHPVIVGIIFSVPSWIGRWVQQLPWTVTLSLAMCLFVAGLYLAKYPELSAMLARGSSKEERPDLVAWRHRSRYYAFEAACLFAECAPRMVFPAGSAAGAWLGTILVALNDGAISRIEIDGDTRLNVNDAGQYVAHDQTQISKAELRRLAESLGVKPGFLR
jgi:hypothetical protein